MIPVKEHFPNIKTTPLFFPSVIYPKYDTYGNEYVICIPDNMSVLDAHDSSYVFHFYRDDSYLGYGLKYNEVNSHDILISFLEIGMRKFEKSKEWTPIYNEMHELSSYSFDDEATILLIDSFVKYGVYYDWGMAFTESSEKRDGGIGGVMISRFIGGIYDLLVVYKSWCYLAGERGFSIDFLTNVILQYTKSQTISIKTLEDACKHTINSFASMTTGNVKYKYSESGLYSVVYFNGLFDLLLYQLLSIISLGDDSMDGVIANCKECGQQFIKRHGSATLCESCRTPRVKSRNFRRKEKLKKGV